MRNTDLMEALGGLPEDLVKNALKPQEKLPDPFRAAETGRNPAPKKHFDTVWRHIGSAAAIAACIAVVCGFVWLIGKVKSGKLTPLTSMPGAYSEQSSNPENSGDITVPSAADEQINWQPDTVYVWYDCLADGLNPREINSVRYLNGFPEYRFQWMSSSTQSDLYVMDVSRPGKWFWHICADHIQNAFFADVTGDGSPELCLTLELVYYGHYHQVILLDLAALCAGSTQPEYALPHTTPAINSVPEDAYSYLLCRETTAAADRLMLRRCLRSEVRDDTAVSETERGEICFEDKTFFRSLEIETTALKYEPGKVQLWFDTCAPNRNTDALYSILTPDRLPGYQLKAIAEYSSITGIHITCPQKPSVRIAGSPIRNAYFADLNGDGYDELCATCTDSSDLSGASESVVIYDIKNGQRYQLTDPKHLNYALFCQDGALCVRRACYPLSACSRSEACIEGTLRLNDNALSVKDADGQPGETEVLSAFRSVLKKQICDELDGLVYENGRISGEPQYRLKAPGGECYRITDMKYVQREGRDSAALIPTSLRFKLEAYAEEIDLEKLTE